MTGSEWGGRGPIKVDIGQRGASFVPDRSCNSRHEITTNGSEAAGTVKLPAATANQSDGNNKDKARLDKPEISQKTFLLTAIFGMSK